LNSSGNHAFAEEDYSRKPKDKFDGEEMDFGLPKVLVDNSSAVGLLLKQNQFMTKKQD
jgi:hypothetical protein